MIIITKNIARALFASLALYTAGCAQQSMSALPVPPPAKTTPNPTPQQAAGPSTTLGQNSSGATPTQMQPQMQPQIQPQPYPAPQPPAPSSSPIGALISSLISGLTGGGTRPNTPTPNGPNNVQPLPAQPPLPTQPQPPSQGGGTSTDAMRQLCQKTINDYRATVGAGALTLNTNQSTCSDDQTGKDGQVGSAHANFGACQEMAQDECPGWDASDVATSLTGCLKMMWDEGPGGGHYDNMSNNSYRSVACGFNAGNGSLWMVQNFYQ